MGIDLEIFSTLSKANGPVTLEKLATVKNASPLITGTFTFCSPVLGIASGL